MLTGFARFPDSGVRELSSYEGLAEALATEETKVWADLEEPAPEELQSLGHLIGADEAALEDCLLGEQRPRIDEYEDHIFMVLYGVIGPEPAVRFEPCKLALFCGRRFLITVHRKPLRTIGTLRERCQRHPDLALANGIDALAHQIIDLMVDNFVDMADHYETRLEELEEQSLSPEVDESILEGVSDLRRELLELRRVAASQRELLTPLATGEYDYISEDLGQRFNHVRDHLIKVVELIDALRERLAGVRDNYHMALTDRTNDVMRTLTVFAAVLLPLSVIASIYGMNLPVWPSPESPLSFWVVVCAMAALGGGFLWYFKRRGWI